ncbi:MAG: DUF5675 family protein [Sediminibacterium sp.]
MELRLSRILYHALGTNGVLCTAIHGVICYTIELPWLNNRSNHSCIPEGSYRMVKRYSEKFQWHLHLTDVPGRELILLHPANNALLELSGCIAPVTELKGPGQGIQSRRAFHLLMQQVNEALQAGETILLTIIPPKAAG